MIAISSLTESDQQFGFKQLPILAVRHAACELQPALQVIPGLGQPCAFRGTLPGGAVIVRSLGDQARLRAMVPDAAGSHDPDVAVGLDEP